MRKHDRVSGLFFLLLGLAACAMAYRLKFGSVTEPGAGLIPFGVAAILTLMSLGLFLRSWVPAMRVSREGDGIFKGISWGRLVLLIGVLLAFGLALETLGFHLCTFLLMVVLLGAIGRHGLLRTLAFSFFTVVCVYLVFEAWLGCPFPRGAFNI